MLSLSTVTLDILRGYGKLHCKNSQPRFSAQQSDATLLRDFFELAQHCSHIVALKIVVANHLV